MSDDVKSSTSKPRKTRPRILVVNNPGPDSSSSSDEDHIIHNACDYPPAVLASMSTPSFTDRTRVPQSQYPTPLTTNLSEVSRPYPSSRSNPSNPALSSPSSTSSRAFESTPPPSTPGQSNHPEDISSEGTLRQEPVIVPYPDGSDTTPPSATSRVFNRLRFTRPGHTRRSSNTTRPATSPTASIPESFATQQSEHGGSRASPLERVTLLVTTDAEHLVTVDVTGANDAAFIRERIFTKLQIPDDDQKRYSIYRTEIGRFAIGGALTDEQMLELYRERGDERGSIKLLVSHSHASVHEPTLPPELNQSSPPVHTITPPVLPQQPPYPPLRPRRRSRSRRGSMSSASERIPPDPAAGYEASVSDDLDHAEREPRRTTIRALPQQPTAPRLPLPARPRSPGGNYSRPLSPGSLISPDRARVQQDVSGLRPDWARGNALTTPPSTSPDVSRSQDGFQQPIWAAHGRSGSDATLDRERVGALIEYGVEPDRWRRAQEEKEKEERDKQRRREGLRKEPALRRAKVTHHDAAGDAERRRGEGWTMVPSNVHSSGYKKERPTTPQESRPSPSRPQGYPNFNLSMPSRPPPPPPGPGETRERSKRQAGKTVPPSYVISYKGPQTGAKVDSTPTPQSPPPKLTRIMKSMGDMHGQYKAQGSSAAASSGKSRQNLPLPLKPGSSSNSNAVDQFIPSGSNISEGISSSYHDSPLYDMTAMRPLEASRYPALSPSSSLYPPAPSRPVGSSTQPPSLQSSSNYLVAPSSSGQEPYPRPHSSMGSGPTTSPFRSNRTLQSPNGADVSSPETSQHRPSPQGPSHYQGSGTLYRDDNYHAGTNFGPRPIPSRHERSNTDTLTALEHSTLVRQPRTPPRSPIRDKTPPLEPKAESLQVVRTLSSLPVHEDETPSSSESTVRRDQYTNIVRMLGGGSSSSSGSNTLVLPRSQYGTIESSSSTAVGSYDDRPISSTASSAGHGSVPSDDSDSEAGTIWAKAPPRGLNGSRPVLAPIDTDSSPSSRSSPLPRDSSRQPPVNFPPPPGYIPESPPVRRMGRNITGNGRNLKDQRTSRFDNNFDATWAPRPPPEEVLERLQEYFPEHDVDEPVIEAPSGGTSPTSTTADHNPVPAAEKRSRHKKSIRVVAAERRRIDRSSHMEPTNNGPGAALRKRNTKLWGSRLEEVPTYGQAHLQQLLPSANDSSPGTAKPIFRWVRGELIGKGTYGKVYLALNATTGEMIAVKQVEMPRTASDKNDSRQVTVVEALKLESETLKDLDHPNIVQYLGFEETPTFLSIFLEYVPGGSIASCLRKHGKFDEDVTKSFTGQILGGLEYLHSKGILHRDMKADNILVEKTGICKISDFGIAKRTDDIDMAGAYTSMQGTVFWMAPEVIDANGKGYNSKIDIWSVGCVVFEMWTGQRPWSGKEAMAVLLQLYQTKQGPPVPKDITLSPLADDFRQKCFAMNPDERPTAAELRFHPYLELPLDWAFSDFK